MFGRLILLGITDDLRGAKTRFLDFHSFYFYDIVKFFAYKPIEKNNAMKWRNNGKPNLT